MTRMGLWIAALGTAIAVSIASVMLWPNRTKITQIAAPVDSSASYDWEGSRRNLEVIGRALQMYRESNGAKPTAARHSYVDAGMPPSLITILCTPGNRLVDDRYLFAKESRLQPGEDRAQLGSNYIFVYDDIPFALTKGDLAKIWSSRGDEIPIMLDLNMHEGEYLSPRGWKGPREVSALVLRLGGRVDVVRFRVFDYRDLFWNR